MNRFIIQKLIVISEKEKKSREIDFKTGMNIIIGKNKTGKSSIIKSIFYTLGCEVKMEPSWKNNIDWFLLEFKYGDRKFEIIRHGKRFLIVELESILIDTSSFHEFCDYLTIEIFNIDIPFITNDLKPVNVTTPILWRFQYIDQDKGWNKIAESFTNMGYIRNWKEFSNKFVIGFQGEEYYRLKKEINLSKIIIEDLKAKLKHYHEMLEHINLTISVTHNSSKNISENLDIMKSIVSELESLERNKASLTERLSEAKNLHYERNLALKMLKKTIGELEDDHKFAQNEDEYIICPFCGTNHDNTIIERTEIIKDIQTGNELVKEYRKEVAEIRNEIDNLTGELSQTNKDLRNKKIILEKEKQGISIANTYKIEGKKEFIKISQDEQSIIKASINKELGEIELKTEDLKTFESRKRANEVREEFKIIYTRILDKLNVPQSFLKLRDFVQVLDNTGSELPRLIYAYHIALYLYNLEKNRGVFNWLVVDTPNQQGQDDENLIHIDKIMSELTNTSGQFIIGTERETGFENKARNVIQLTDYKQTLKPEYYQVHKDYIEQVLKH
ncbi:hypothetical protein [Psychrobacillus sp. MER TA 171]|uniref:hypothetical protein n=1 Tax=Psychrobacillus sp. MER TA 171 TaxID=2939577 RepID=UPI002040BC1F|nr:hypothetical protein [Psychrobacillus sp. MER TA 171]MCM3359541.1 hypothetical protein [Psychrobacillus sp. MER TA 171]